MRRRRRGYFTGSCDSFVFPHIPTSILQGNWNLTVIYATVSIFECLYVRRHFGEVDIDAMTFQYTGDK